MIAPSRRLVAALALACIPFILDIWLPGLRTVGWLAAAGLALGVALDLAFAPRRSAFDVTLQTPPVLSLLTETSLPLTLRNRSGAGGAGWIRAVLPDSWDVDRLLSPIRVPAHGVAEAAFRVKPKKRGKYTVGPLFLRHPSPLGFLWRDYRFDLTATVKVYPALQAIRQWTLLSRSLRTRELGLRSHRLRGQGMEFARLREHHPDDGMRLIDWKATARRGRFIAREYQVERCQNIVFMIDAGRMLTAEVDGIVKIEYVLNAALLLTRIAAEYDDRLGAMVFSDKVERMTPLRKGHAAVGAMAEALYDVEPRLVEADYELAFSTLNRRFRKRSLVILFTNLVDQSTSELVSGFLRGLSWRHVPLCVAVGDRETQEIAWSSPRTVDDAYRKGAAAQLLISRARTLQELQRHGVHVVDAPAGQVGADLINKYLELKARQLL